MTDREMIRLPASGWRSTPTTGQVVCLGSRDGVNFDWRAPFLLTDGGRTGSRRPRQRNDCTVRALALASDADYDRAYDTLAAAGRRCGRGFEFRRWAKQTSFAGYAFRWIGCPAVKGQWRTNPVTFALAHPNGRYILRTAKHVIACVDGVLMDSVEPDPWRCVYGAWELTPND